VVTELGIEKNKDFNLEKKDIQKVKNTVKAAGGNGEIAGKDSTGGAESCCG